MPSPIVIVASLALPASIMNHKIDQLKYRSFNLHVKIDH